MRIYTQVKLWDEYLVLFGYFAQGMPIWSELPSPASDRRIMELEVLVATVGQTDLSLVEKMNLRQKAVADHSKSPKQTHEDQPRLGAPKENAFHPVALLSFF